MIRSKVRDWSGFFDWFKDSNNKKDYITMRTRAISWFKIGLYQSDMFENELKRQIKLRGIDFES
jgi:hypothetical protein